MRLKLVQGKPAFAADFEKRGLLVAKVLHSPYAHARIRSELTPAGLASSKVWRPCSPGRISRGWCIPLPDSRIQSQVHWILFRWIIKSDLSVIGWHLLLLRTAEIAEQASGADRGGV